MGEMATIVSEPITATWESGGAGVTGLTPSIRIIDLSDNSTVLTDTMAAVDATNCPGTYKYVFTTFNVAKKYVARIDGGGGTEDRYRTIALRADTVEVASYFQDQGIAGGGSGWTSKTLIERLLAYKLNGRTIGEILANISEPDFKPLEQKITAIPKKIEASKKELLIYAKECHQDSMGELESMKTMNSSQKDKKELLGAMKTTEQNIIRGQGLLSEIIQNEAAGVNTTTLTAKEEIKEALQEKEMAIPEKMMEKINEKEQRLRIKRKKALLLSQMNV